MMVITVLITPQLNVVPSLAIRTQCCGTCRDNINILSVFRELTPDIPTQLDPLDQES